jgi:hypothetical protein
MLTQLNINIIKTYMLVKLTFLLNQLNINIIKTYMLFKLTFLTILFEEEIWKFALGHFERVEN